MKRFLLITLLTSAFAVSGCSTDAPQIQSFCSEVKTAVSDNASDCDAMGGALLGVLSNHRGKSYVGNTTTDLEAFRPCEEARSQIILCQGRSAQVQEAIRILNAPRR